ncbi:hypothetical protein PACTADRAFT_169 [Pachysolen tannophilus NRRL Y-2460]|uniref:RNase III domain-containing protein n=1 Tax=Pachysolen tannophilus NRRL Y-2460 TaxID=669874 RepID=A0A1E4U150_PACTA|nr:hypothetical protein PACTADRAFT_169 [Pachysolen tannophilus NRRL Y-2460]
MASRYNKLVSSFNYCMSVFTGTSSALKSKQEMLLELKASVSNLSSQVDKIIDLQQKIELTEDDLLKNPDIKLMNELKGFHLSSSAVEGNRKKKGKTNSDISKFINLITFANNYHLLDQKLANTTKKKVSFFRQNHQEPLRSFPVFPPIKDGRLKKIALIHPAIKNEMEEKLKVRIPNSISKDNQRFECFGDALLGMIVSEYIFKRFPNATDGFLTCIRSLLVSNDTLRYYSRYVDLENIIYEFTSVELDNERNAKTLADCFESYICGCYFDGKETYGKMVDCIYQLIEPIVIQFEKNLKASHGYGELKVDELLNEWFNTDISSKNLSKDSQIDLKNSSSTDKKLKKLPELPLVSTSTNVSESSFAKNSKNLDQRSIILKQKAYEESILRSQKIKQLTKDAKKIIAINSKLKRIPKKKNCVNILNQISIKSKGTLPIYKVIMGKNDKKICELYIDGVMLTQATGSSVKKSINNAVLALFTNKLDKLEQHFGTTVKR